MAIHFAPIANRVLLAVTNPAVAPEVQRARETRLSTSTTPLAPIANRVLVAVTNPVMASGLLRLGLALADPLNGIVFAAYIQSHESVVAPDKIAALQVLVDQLAADTGVTIKLVTQTAPTVARGLLDVAAERAIDLVILGTHQEPGGEIFLGPIVEEVARTAPQHVVIYRGRGRHYDAGQFEEIIVPVDGSLSARLAARVGLQIKQYTGALWMTACHVPHRKQGHNCRAPMTCVENTLVGLESQDIIRKESITEQNSVDGILRRATADSLVILGVSEQRWSRDNWLKWKVPRRLLNEMPGAVMLVKQSARDRQSLQMRLRYRFDDLLPTLTPQEHSKVIQEGEELTRSTTNFYVLVLLSSLIASLGLLQNSVAVIIGAMLIAPLMSPLMGFALGLTQGQPRNMQRALLTVAKGVALVLLLTVILGAIWPIKNPTGEMLARGTPSLLDLLVAMFSGAAGAFALARKDVSSALAGVAIAAALMPPLCTVGMAYAFGATALAGGALLLFLTNIVSISLAAAIVFLWMGLRLRLRHRSVPYQRLRILMSGTILVLLMIPLTVSLGQWVRTANRVNTSWVTLREIYGSTAVMDIELREVAEDVSVIATVRIPREIWGYEMDETHIEVIMQGEELLRERLGVEKVLLYVDAQPLFGVPGQAPAEAYLTDGLLHGLLRRETCANQAEETNCDY